MSETIQLTRELDELPSPHGLLWTRVLVTVDVYGRDLDHATITDLEVLDFVGESIEADQFRGSERIRMRDQITDAVRASGRLDGDELERAAIEKVQRLEESRRESFLEEAYIASRG